MPSGIEIAALHNGRALYNAPRVVNAALVLFSAGQDSATCLAWALRAYERVETIGFDYGQRHAIELRSTDDAFAQQIAHYDWRRSLGGDIVVDLTGFGALAESALTSSRAVEWANNGLPATFVPGRNLVFFTIAAAHAYRRGVATLVGGMCETDCSGYPDCRRDTIEAMQRTLSLGLDTANAIETPLMHLTKAPDLGARRRTRRRSAWSRRSSSTPTPVMKATARIAMIGAMAATPAPPANCAPRAGASGPKAAKPRRPPSAAAVMTYAVKEMFFTLQGRGRAHRAARLSSCGSPAAICGAGASRIVRSPSASSATPNSSASTAMAAASSKPRRGLRRRRSQSGRAAAARPTLSAPAASRSCNSTRALIEAFHARGFEIAIETNGTLAAPPGIDWICVSPKANADLVQNAWR